MARTPQPQEVFTPRSAQVNSQMYIDRPNIEIGFRKGTLSSKCLVLHGESGTGKSWLYKKMFSDMGIHYETVNMALVSRYGDINSAIAATADRLGGDWVTGYSESKSAGGGIPGLGTAELAHEKQYAKPQVDGLLRLMQTIRENIGSKKSAFVIFENLEQVTHCQNLLRELCGIILLADDETYANHFVNILLVGTPCELCDIIAGADRSNTVINRLNELPEVTVLSVDGARDFLDRGFISLLKYEYAPTLTREIFHEDVIYSTDRIPQHLHELCLEIAYACEENGGVISDTALAAGKLEWVRKNLISELEIVRSNLNKTTTKIGRRNQIMFTLANQRRFDFTPREIESDVRNQFPEQTKERALNVPQLLSDLAKSDHPIIRQSKHGSAYRFVSPKLKIIIRTALTRDGNGGLVVNDQVFGEMR